MKNCIWNNSCDYIACALCSTSALLSSLVLFYHSVFGMIEQVVNLISQLSGGFTALCSLFQYCSVEISAD